jgi:Ca2+-binding EF-hand superfamily protein
MWRRMDRDNSGALTRQELDCEEFYTIIRSILLPAMPTVIGMGGPVYSRAEMDMDQAIAFGLRKADFNQDGKISFEEFKSFVSVLRQPTSCLHTANIIFALFDVSRNGFVEIGEFREIYRFYLGRNPTEAEFQQEWSRLDQTNKGKVSREDYVRWLQTSSNPIFKEHSPQPLSKVMSGSIDYHAAKRESILSSTSGGLARASASAPEPWRPWHGYTNHAWARVQQRKPEADSAEQSCQSIARSSLSTPASRNAQRQVPDQRMSRSASSLLGDHRRWSPPPWNQRFVTANDNWLDTAGTPRRPKGSRKLLSAPQTPTQLAEHYATHRGFKKHARSLAQPEISFHRQSKCSQDCLDVSMSPELLPSRSLFKHGRMKNPRTGKREHWEDNWQSTPQLRNKYVSGSNSLRCIGKPPQHLYMDDYEAGAAEWA